MATPVTFVIFGGTGDLAKRKLVPAFAELIHKKVLSPSSAIIGVGRTEFTDASYKQMLIDFQETKELKLEVKKLNIKYYHGDVEKHKDVCDVRFVVESCKNENIIFYLATSFTLFEAITQQIAACELQKVAKGFTRVIFEKPFGQDLASFRKLDTVLHTVFSEEQIFRIDHYLGKETVKNLSVLKYANPMFDTLLNNCIVDRINITVDENLPVGKRAHYYNEFGAIKDMIQSHLLQVIALLLMDRPKSMSAQEIHREKIKILAKIVPKEPQRHLLGQYASYSRELAQYTLKDKKTETFARIELECTSQRWKGVPIIVRTGKMLAQRYGQIIVRFKIPREFKDIEKLRSNKLVIDIQPEQDVRLSFNILKQGTKNLENVDLYFCHSCHFGPNTSDGYEKMITDIVDGENMQFITSKELELSWKIVDTLLRMKPKIPFIIYKDHTDPEARKV